jgi:hypothetical protein
MTKKTSKCAFCPSSGPFTKEHIWPKSLIQKYEELRAFSPKTNTFYKGEAVIKDVCATCNNEKLSILDTYLSKIFDSSFGRILQPGESAQLKFDYELLLRGLLKISYNSARASADEKTKALYAKFANYIAHNGYCPKIMLRLQVVTSSRARNLDDGSEEPFSPELMRSAVIKYNGPLGGRFCIRMVAINSFWFYLITPYKQEPNHKWDELLNGFSEWVMQPGVLVEKGTCALDIPKEKTTYFHPALLGSLLQAETN